MQNCAFIIYCCGLGNLGQLYWLIWWIWFIFLRRGGGVLLKMHLFLLTKALAKWGVLFIGLCSGTGWGHGSSAQQGQGLSAEARRSRCRNREILRCVNAGKEISKYQECIILCPGCDHLTGLRQPGTRLFPSSSWQKHLKSTSGAPPLPVTFSAFKYTLPRDCIFF